MGQNVRPANPLKRKPWPGWIPTLWWRDHFPNETPPRRTHLWIFSLNQFLSCPPSLSRMHTRQIEIEFDGYEPRLEGTADGATLGQMKWHPLATYSGVYSYWKYCEFFMNLPPWPNCSCPSGRCAAVCRVIMLRDEIHWKLWVPKCAPGVIFGMHLLLECDVTCTQHPSCAQYVGKSFWKAWIKDLYQQKHPIRTHQSQPHQIQEI